MRHKLSKIWITFRTYYITSKGTTRRRWTEKEKIVEAVKFIRELLKPKQVEVVYLKNDEVKSYFDENKLPKKVILRGIEVNFDKPLEKTYTEEYEEIYKPIDEKLLELGIPLYNMWGYGEKGGGWQMDGRHVHLDKK